MTCKSPINIITTSATPDSNGIQFNYKAGDCTSAKGSKSGISFIRLTPKNKNTIIYKNNTYVLTKILLYKNSLHTVDGKFFAGELVLMHECDKPSLLLNICIPVSLTTDIKKSSFGTILKKVPSTVYSFQSPKTFIPTTSSYYSYSGTDFNVCSKVVEYIVFATSSVQITLAEFNDITNNTYKRLNNTGIVIYSHTNQSSINSAVNAIGSLVSSGNRAVSFGDDNIYIDCQSVDAPNTPNMSAGSSMPPQQSINFSNLQNNKLIQMLLMFIIFMIVMVIFFYSYEFTTGMFRELTKSVASIAKMNPL